MDCRRSWRAAPDPEDGLNDWSFNSGDPRRKVDWLAIDSWIDSSIFGAVEQVKDGWAHLTSFNQRFNLTGGWRLANEGLSEAASLATLGALALLALAIPSFEVMRSENPLGYSKYAFTFLDQDGNELGKRGVRRSDAVTLEEMPDHFIKSLLATEDRRFFEHYGVDVYGTGRAIVEDVRSADARQGGSTLTQQLAKNAFLSSEKSLQRKVKEAFLAMWLEYHYTKHDILKLYLERAYMGGGAIGAEAGAQFYFGKSIRAVTLAEAAMLAGLFKAPTKYAPHTNVAEARKRADEVLSNLVEAGFMTEAQVHEARLNPATAVVNAKPESPDWFLDWAFEEGQRLMQSREGTVVTAKVTVDLGMQKLGEQTISNAIRDYGKGWGAKQAALVAVDAEGAVRAVVGGVDYGESAFNRAASAKRQPGSSLKPYVYLTAVEKLGLTPQSIVSGAGYTCKNGHPVRGEAGGNISLSQAMARSVNTVAVRLSDSVGRGAVNETLEALHIGRQIESCTMALGDGGVTLVEHTGGFTTFINGGRGVKPYGITEIRNSRGELVYVHDRDEPKPEQIFKPSSIETMNQLMHGVMTDGTAAGSNLDFTMAVGKTGTTSSHRDAWFMGATGRYAVGVWIGNDDNRVMHGIFGGQSAAPIWKTFMTGAHTTPDIPQLAGLPLHPNQIIRMQQFAESQAAAGVGLPKKKEGREGALPDSLKLALRQIETAMRRAGRATQGTEGADGLPEPPAAGDAVEPPAAPPAISPRAALDSGGPQPTATP